MEIIIFGDFPLDTVGAQKVPNLGDGGILVIQDDNLVNFKVLQLIRVFSNEKVQLVKKKNKHTFFRVKCHQL